MEEPTPLCFDDVDVDDFVESPALSLLPVVSALVSVLVSPALAATAAVFVAVVDGVASDTCGLKPPVDFFTVVVQRHQQRHHRGGDTPLPPTTKNELSRAQATYIRAQTVGF